MKIVKKWTDVDNDWKMYIKIPIEVRAVELTEEVTIHTREGVLKGYKGDFLIESIEGEIYPCGREIFFKTYKERKLGF